MGISEELAQLSELHETGRLSDEEFRTAKAQLLAGIEPGTSSRSDPATPTASTEASPPNPPTGPEAAPAASHPERTRSPALLVACVAAAVAVVVIAGLLLWPSESGDSAASVKRFCDIYHTEDPNLSAALSAGNSSSASFDQLQASVDAAHASYDRIRAAVPPSIKTDFSIMYDNIYGSTSQDKLSEQRKVDQATTRVNAYIEKKCDLKGNF